MSLIQVKANGIRGSSLNYRQLVWKEKRTANVIQHDVEGWQLSNWVVKVWLFSPEEHEWAGQTRRLVMRTLFSEMTYPLVLWSALDGLIWVKFVYFLHWHLLAVSWITNSVTIYRATFGITVNIVRFFFTVMIYTYSTYNVFFSL